MMVVGVWRESPWWGLHPSNTTPSNLPLSIKARQMENSTVPSVEKSTRHSRASACRPAPACLECDVADSV